MERHHPSGLANHLSPNALGPAADAAIASNTESVRPTTSRVCPQISIARVARVVKFAYTQATVPREAFITWSNHE